MSDWGRYLGDATVAMAILDRLAMSAIRIEVDGPSYRQHVGELRAKKGTPPSRVGKGETSTPKSQVAPAPASAG